MKKEKNPEKIPPKKRLNPEAKGNDAHFGLTEEIENYSNLDMGDEDLSNIGNFLQKMHLRNHTVSSKETIHEVYRSDEVMPENESEFISQEDELIFLEIQKAVAERDIIDLRNSLKFISKNVSAHNVRYEEIEDFLEGELDEDISLRIQKEASINPKLADDIRLYREISEAIAESDILELRASLDRITHVESSHSRSIGEIEEYLEKEMEESLVNSFEDEIQSNPGLLADVTLCHEINQAIGERDIISLRTNLDNIKQSEIDADGSQKRGITSLPFRKTAWYAAASIVLLIGLTLTFKNNSYTDSEVYKEFYRPMEGNIGATRSASLSGESLINLALIKMNNKEYETASELFSEVLKNDKENIIGNFYSGAIHQINGRYNDAIDSYSNVIRQGDNLFVEQSEWCIGLCYLNANEREKAIRQFRKINQSKGFYRQQAKAILKRLD